MHLYIIIFNSLQVIFKSLADYMHNLQSNNKKVNWLNSTALALY